jgi:hypothetical protein
MISQLKRLQREQILQVCLNSIKEIKQDFLNLATLFNESDKRSLGYTINETLITCLYNNKRCSSRDFNWYYSYDYGNCFSFNTGVNETDGTEVKMKEARRPGILVKIKALFSHFSTGYLPKCPVSFR